MTSEKCEYGTCEGIATKSIRLTIDYKNVDKSYCVGHYWTIATQHYGSD
jgi:hypothetical protein